MIIRQETNRALMRTAFTLMEILVVVAIIVALAGVGGFYFMNTLKQSQRKTADLQVKRTLTDAVRNYMLDHSGALPPGLEALTVQDPTTGTGPYVSAQALRDPWNNFYQIDPSTMNADGVFRIYTIAPGDTVPISNF